jgi:hypothetical protein
MDILKRRIITQRNKLIKIKNKKKRWIYLKEE